MNFSKIFGTTFYTIATENCFWKWIFFKIAVLWYQAVFYSIKIFKNYQWRSSILVKLPAYSNGTLSQAYFSWFRTDIKQLFCRRSPTGCFKMNKNRHFVQYNDQRKMWNTTPSEITKCQNNVPRKNSVLLEARCVLLTFFCQETKVSRRKESPTGTSRLIFSLYTGGPQPVMFLLQAFMIQ